VAENYIVEGIIKYIGEVQQISFTDKETNQPKVFTKIAVEVQVGDESRTYEGASYLKDKLTVGSKYSLEMQPKDPYADNIKKVTFLEAGVIPSSNGTVQQSTVQPVQQAVVQPIQESAPTPQEKRPLKVDFAARWREWNTNARLAAMQATDRVKIYVHLMEEGKLVNSEGVKPDALTISTIREWLMQEIDLYWDEHEKRVPVDAFGRWEE